MTLAAAIALQLALSPCAIDGVPGEVKCGTYSVRENPDARGGRERVIGLSVIVLSALEPSNKRPDPFFMLSGGPGDAPSFNARFFSRAFQETRKTRDIVLIDLRGTGKSSPLFCPELGKPGADGIYDADLLSVPAVRACRTRLEQTRDLRFYTTEIAVDDLEAVRQALGYGPINLYGTSYGSRVAQVYMRRYPKSIRAVAMKGVVRPSMAMPANHAKAGDDAWKAVVARCAKDAECRRAYPDPDAEFQQLLTRLEKTAPLMTLPAGSSRPAATVRVTLGLFAEAFRNTLYTPEGSAHAPKLVRQLLNGDDRGLAETALSGRTALGGERLAAGFFLSVTCAEDIPFLPKNADAMAAGTFGGAYRLEQQRAACREWPRGAVSSAHGQPVTSAIPTLLLSGELDPVTPPSGGDEVARTLSNGRHVVIRNNGHPIGNAEACIGRMIAQFLDRGSAEGIDTRCAADHPAPPFVIGKDQ
ncbi:MAG TPA: alpha/beta hydrolase [Vicinamibacterales bacterium]|nr:alpha/beta hydrolase [Vicinamibacterales bacterium]